MRSVQVSINKLESAWVLDINQQIAKRLKSAPRIKTISTLSEVHYVVTTE